MFTSDDSRYGALPVESRRAGRVPGPLPRRDPPQATGGHPNPPRGVRLRNLGVNATDQDANNANNGKSPSSLKVLQWNAEGIYNKKVPFTARLHAENIDIACVQETHLNPHHRFIVRGYQTFRKDREERHKGGVMILVKNCIVAEGFEVNTNQQAEIHGVKISTNTITLTVFNIYCPTDKDLALDQLNIPQSNLLVVGDFNSHSPSWGYDHTDRRGDLVEDWQTDNNLLLLNDPDDPPTFFSRRWLSTSTPDLAFTSGDLAPSTSRDVKPQLAGSDHKPILLSLSINYKPNYCKSFPRWNYKKADWNEYARLTDEFTTCITTYQYNVNSSVNDFNNALLKAATKTIPRGARRNYRPYWTEELQQMEDELTEARENVEGNPTTENNIYLKEKSAKHKKTYIQEARKSWREKTRDLNLERDGTKLWKLTKALNNENCGRTMVSVQEGEEILIGKKAANHFINFYEKISNTEIPENIKLLNHRAMKDIEDQLKNRAIPSCMNASLKMSELENAINTLRLKRSPGPDRVTNEMLLHLGPQSKKSLLAIFNTSWRMGILPQCWREADMVPIHKSGKDRKHPGNYRPISLTSCVGKLLERIINCRLSWFLESNHILIPEQAGFRRHRSTEDQVTYVAQKIEDAFQDKKQTLAVWIDLEKAFDKVWKDGLRLKLLQIGIAGKMYKWISQYLTNRKARVQVNGAYSQKRTLREGVPQGGVLSPTLFLVFINDILTDFPRRVNSAMYADDLVIWSSEEYLSTTNYKVQNTLKVLETWTNRWLVKINPTKTKYTVFSLSTKPQQDISLRINGQTLDSNDNPTYLGITFDKRLTWRKQVERAETNARSRLCLMRKISGSNWGADATTLKQLYNGSVRPVLEYGMTAWSTTAKTNFDRLRKVQNQAGRIISGAMKSTPINYLESATGLVPLEDRRDEKLLNQAAKFKRLKDHPMEKRQSEPTKGRLKRESFVRQTRVLERGHPDLLDHDIKHIIPADPSPIWMCSHTTNVTLETKIPGVREKKEQSPHEKKTYTLAHLEENYNTEDWTHVYTDGSAENAVRNGGAGIYIRYPDGIEDNISIPTGVYSTNYKAEAEALRTAADHVMESQHASQNVVFLTDALSVVQAIQSRNNLDLHELDTSLRRLSSGCKVVLQWIPSHCNLVGNDRADSLAKEGSSKAQTDKSTSYGETKTIVRAEFAKKWKNEHPNHRLDDAYFQLDREGQVTLTRLRSGHNRLHHHLFTKLKIGSTGLCDCGTDRQTAEHILQLCPKFAELRSKYWPTTTDVHRKLYGDLRSLTRTMGFIRETGLNI